MKGLRTALVCALVVLLLAGNAEAKRTYAAIVVDHASGRVLHQSNADQRLYPASLTKMMTLYMLFDALERGEVTPETRFRISKKAEGMPASKIGFTAGNTIRVADAIPALIIKSANDVAVIVAEGLGGSEAAFAHDMTRRARELGMTSTTFRNASGLPDTEQKSTARDMATLSRRMLIDFPQYYPLFALDSFRYGGRTFRSHNRLLKSYAGMDGLKTGYIRASGFNLAASAVRGGRRVTAVVFGGRTARSRDAEMARLLDLGFEKAGSSVPLVLAGPPLPKPVPGPTTVAAMDPDQQRQVEVVSLAGLGLIPEANAGAIVASGPPAAAARPTVVATRPAEAASLVPRERPPSFGLRLRQGAPKAPALGGYAVQVGAYYDPEAARLRALDAMRQAPDILLQGDVDVSALRKRRNTVYRARLVGYSKPQAEAACRSLERRKFDCLVVQVDDVQLARGAAGTS